MYLQKYSYLSSNSPKTSKLGIKLVLSHRLFSGLSSMQMISLWKPEKLERKLRKKWGIQLSYLLLSIQNWYEINNETKLFYSG